MNDEKRWMFAEGDMIGVDYCDPKQVEVYDQRHESFRDFETECRDICQKLDITKNDIVLDLGAGTGAFAVNAARYCKKVYAVDIAAAMLAKCKAKAEAKGITNIEYRTGGFLSYEHTDPPVDAVVSMAALHHIPDLWKFVGLSRCANMLKPGGKFFLMDVVFSVDAHNWKQKLQDWVDQGVESLHKDFAKEVYTHISREFSTIDWIMEGILTRCGFNIDEIDNGDGMLNKYVCTKR